MSDPDWIILRLEAPLLAFGGVTIDHVGVTRDFPAQSMLAGLLANALGYERTDWENIQHLQDRLVFAARRDRDDETALLTDVQNAWLEKSSGWTTRGPLEARAEAHFPHRRRRDFHMDARVMVALRLEPAGRQPDLDALAVALEKPARPLFIGRKPCLPSAPILLPGRVHAPNAHAALLAIGGKPDAPRRNMRALWPHGEGPESGADVWRVTDLPDLRNWRTGLHGGTRRIVEGTVFSSELAT